MRHISTYCRRTNTRSTGATFAGFFNARARLIAKDDECDEVQLLYSL